MAYRDSLVNIETNKRIAELEIEYETEKKDRLLAENQLKIAKRERQLALLGGGVVILILIGFGGYKYQQMRHRQQQKELELRNQLKQAEYEQEIAGQKLRISRELHDNIGSQLTFLISSLDNLGYRMEEDHLKNRLDDLGDFGRSTLDELRNTVWAVKHENAGLEALLMKLNELKRHFGDHKNGIALQIHDDLQKPVEMSSTQMLNLLRITQEAPQNAVKHAEASQVTISIHSDVEEFRLTISDDGSGFNLEEKSRGNGLANMRQRCEEAGGEFNLKSDEDGTTISCIFSRK
ncbi:MAG: Oxygen sensor histidine kinase response regulator DevS/DosS [Candidatus Marinimicrobia bacterium]|nr:Oxygen sensor histidine kinase response regulator DevS/DosS [Candidatus Neomarinimicrobiota bacterium]